MYEQLYVGMLSLNRLRIKTNRNERWGISLTYSKNRRGPKIDPRGTPQEILDKSETGPATPGRLWGGHGAQLFCIAKRKKGNKEKMKELQSRNY